MTKYTTDTRIIKEYRAADMKVGDVFQSHDGSLTLQRCASTMRQAARPCVKYHVPVIVLNDLHNNHVGDLLWMCGDSRVRPVSEIILKMEN